MPFQGRPTDDILKDLRSMRDTDPPTHGGRVLSYVYDPGIDGLDELVAQAVTEFLPVNGLDPTTFTSVARLERDVVSFARTITKGDSDVVGSVTSGGTESCMLAVKSARQMWREIHDEPQGRPVLIAPTTAHAAFHKACDYFDLDMVSVPIDPQTGSVDAQQIISVVDDHIEAGNPPVLVVLSAPNYPLGTIDDIGTIAPEMAQRGVPVHVDACVGGFVLPFWPDALPSWDFSVDGVVSISLDAHKYGYAPKGVSVVLYRGRQRHRAQYFATVLWPGYPIVNPTMLGSRSATALAAAWAIINRLGTEGYQAATAKIHQAAHALRETFRELPGMEIVGEPVGFLLAVASKSGGTDPFLFLDALKERGFLAQAQPAFQNLPRSVHMSVTPVTAQILPELTTAIQSAAAQVHGVKPPAPNLNLVKQIATEGLPVEQAEVMATLEALPPELAPGALIEVLASVIDPD